MGIRMTSVGDNVVDRYLDQGVMYAGGSAANVAVHSRRLGVEAGYIGAIGDDTAGEYVLGTLREEDVDLSRVRRVDEPNSYSDVRIDRDGNRTFEAYQPPSDVLKLSADDLAYLAGSTWIHTGHTSQADAMLPEMAEIAAVVFDFSYKDLTYAGSLLPYISTAVFSRSDESDEELTELIEDVRARGPQTVVVTRGARGALIGTDDVILRTRAFDTDVVDTLGAGDAFIASFTTQRFIGVDLHAASRFATMYAARVCNHYGAFGRPMELSSPAEEAE